MVLPMGQIYIKKPIEYVYPFNRGIKEGVTTNFQGEGGDLAVGDELIFT